MPYDSSKNDGEMTDLEKGLTKWNRDKAFQISVFENQMEKRVKFIIELLKDNHEKLKEALHRQ